MLERLTLNRSSVESAVDPGWLLQKTCVHLNQCCRYGYKGFIMVYSIKGSTACAKAKATLRENNLAFIDVRLDLFPNETIDIEKVPVIYFNEVNVGGYESLMQLINDKTKFRQYVDMVKFQAPGPGAPVPPDPSKRAEDRELIDLDTAVQEIDFHFEQLAELTKVGILRRHRKRFKVYPFSCRGRALFTYLTQKNGLGGEEAFEKAQALLDKRFGRYYKLGEIFENSNRLYVLHDREDVEALNWGVRMTLPENVSPRIVNENFRTCLNRLYGKYVRYDGKRVNYDCIEKSDEYKAYKLATGNLIYMDIEGMSVVKRMSFFINVFNALVIHGMIEKGQPLTWIQRRSFFKHTKYIIGRQLYSLNDVQHGVLRGNKKGVGHLRKPFRRKDPRLANVLNEPDPLIHFALCHGAVSSPPIRIYTPECVEEQLYTAAFNFLDDEGCTVDMKKRHIKLSPIFSWYMTDFQCKKKELIGVVVSHMADGLKKDNVSALHRSKNYTYSFLKYDWSINSYQ